MRMTMTRALEIADKHNLEGDNREKYTGIVSLTLLGFRDPQQMKDPPRDSPVIPALHEFFEETINTPLF